MSATANSNPTQNSNNTYEWDGDPDLAVAEWWSGYDNSAASGAVQTSLAHATSMQSAWIAHEASQNSFNWIQQLGVPALQAAAQVAIMEYQKDQYDDIEQKRVGYLDAAVSQWNSCVNSLMDDIKNATDDVPEAAMYQPVSPVGEQTETIADNIEATQLSAKYASMVSENHIEMDLARAVILNPKYYQMSEIAWCSIEDLMNGIIPVGLTVQSLTKSAEETLATGRLGRGKGHYRRNLGILDYSLQKAAREEQRQERASINRDISSLARQGDIREMMQTPQQRIAYAIQQGQLIQNSLQNANNACAKKAPYLMQQVQVNLQKCQQELQLLAGKASMVNGFVPDFASVLNNQIRDFTNGIGNMLSNDTRPTTSEPHRAFEWMNQPNVGGFSAFNPYGKSS